MYGHFHIKSYKENDRFKRHIFKFNFLFANYDDEEIV